MSDERDPLVHDETLDRIAESVVDGNAVAGMLAEATGADMTAVPGQCANCARVSVVAQLRAYVRAPGAVLRCPHCDHVVMRIVRTETATLVDLRGAAFLRFERR